VCHLSACPSFTGINKFSTHLANPSSAIYVTCQPVPALQASTNFLIIWLTLVLPCVSSVGLSQLYKHQQIFYSPGQPQICHICYLSACPSFTCINKFSTHLADPSFAMSVSCQPVPALQASTNFLIIRPTLFCHVSHWLACPSFTGINKFSTHPVSHTKHVWYCGHGES